MGNANSGPKREKPFLQALNMELAAGGKDHKKLRAIAAQLIAKAEEGDMQAVKEIADRMDGRPAQSVVDDETGGPLQVIVKQFILADDDK